MPTSERLIPPPWSSTVAEDRMDNKIITDKGNFTIEFIIKPPIKKEKKAARYAP